MATPYLDSLRHARKERQRRLNPPPPPVQAQATRPKPEAVTPAANPLGAFDEIPWLASFVGSLSLNNYDQFTIHQIKSPPRTSAEIARVIRDDILKSYNFSLCELNSHRRNTKLVHARNHLAYLLRRHTTWSLPQIGRFLNRDHSTIIHAIAQHTKRNGLSPICSCTEGGAYNGL